MEIIAASVGYNGDRILASQEVTLKYWRIGKSLTVMLLIVAGALSPAASAAELMTKVKVGDPAPDFTLQDHNNKPVKLSDFRGKKNVVLAFYVLAFTSG